MSLQFLLSLKGHLVSQEEKERIQKEKEERNSQTNNNIEQSFIGTYIIMLCTSLLCIL